jgi:hypothetical protein
VVAVIAVISVLPIAFEVLRARREARETAQS